MTFQQFYQWMVEFEPLSTEKAHTTLRQILKILSDHYNKKEI